MLVGGLLSLCLLAGVANARFLITAPKYIRNGNDYHMMVWLEDVTSDVMLDVKIVKNFTYTYAMTSYMSQNPNDPVDTNYAYYQYSEAISASAFTNGMAYSKTIVLKDIFLSEIESWQLKYYLVVNLSGGANFTQNNQLYISHKNATVYAQTDKAWYKPGDTVRMRSFLVNSTLQPLHDTFDIEIKDPDNNIIEQWKDETSESYVISKEFDLATQTPLGSWYINIKSGGISKTQQFQVKEYVLPTFEVKLILPPFVTIYDEFFTVNVSAMYTYGEPVNGKGVMCIKSAYKYNCIEEDVQDDIGYYWDNRFCKCLEAELEFEDGMAQKIIQLDELKYLMQPSYDHTGLMETTAQDLAYTNWEITANFTDDLTEKMHSEQSNLMLQGQSMNIEFLPLTPSYYKPGLPFYVFVQISNWDGTAPYSSCLLKNGVQRNITMEVYNSNSWYDYNLQQTINERTNISNITQEVGPTGIVIFEIDPIPVNFDNVRMEASFVDKYEQRLSTTQYVSQFETLNDVMIQVSLDLQNSAVAPGTNVTFAVHTTEPIQAFGYILTGQSDVKKTQYLDFGEPADTTHFFHVYFDEALVRHLAPTGRIIVWYEHKNMTTGTFEVIADSAEFTITGAMVHEVNAQYRKVKNGRLAVKVSPGTELELEVSAEPFSTLGILAVDKSVTLLASGNDITEQMVMQDLQGYNSGSYSPYLYYKHKKAHKRKKRSMWCPSWNCFPYYNTGTDTTTLFSLAQLFVMTDLYVHQKQYEYATYYRGATDEASANGPVGLAGSAGSPGMDGGVAESGGSGTSNNALDDPSGNLDDSDIRDDFPETWIWADEATGADGTASLMVEAPDTITTWMTSVFALDPIKGLGIADVTELIVTKNFFLTLDLPYAVTRNERFLLKVLVFNYKNSERKVRVTLLASEYYDVVVMTNDVSMSVRKIVWVPANEGVLVVFYIKPKIVGQIPITVEGLCQGKTDVVSRNLLVEPEGRLEEYSVTKLLALGPNDSPDTVFFDVQLPDVGVVPGSLVVTLTAIGDLMGSTTANLDRLIRMPSGCGEQNMINLAPNVYIMKYLTESGKLTSAQETKLIKYIKNGYQRELTYRHTTPWDQRGSFSAFGNYDDSGSTWLTAFVMKSFIQASPYVVIDHNVINEAADYLFKYKNDDGSFREPGTVIHTSLQSETGSGVGLTAYILTAILQSRDVINETSYDLQGDIDQSVEYLEKQLDELDDDPYLMSMISYCLVLAGSDLADIALYKLQLLSKEEDGKMWWSEEEENEDDDDDEEEYPWRSWSQTNTADIEMTSYALLAYLESGLQDEALPIVKWLASQKNKFGGYHSTQDTVVALNALAEYASRFYQADIEQALEVTVLPDGKDPVALDVITDDNALVLQSVEILDGVESVEVDISGSGVAMIQFSVQYHTVIAEDSDSIDLTVTPTLNGNTISTEICFRWKKLEADSGMGMLAVQALSGYDFDASGVLAMYKFIKRLEFQGRTIMLYLDQIPEYETCVTLLQYKSQEVTNLQDALVQLYSYYQPAFGQTLLYAITSPDVDMCVVCEACCDDDGYVIVDDDGNVVDGNVVDVTFPPTGGVPTVLPAITLTLLTTIMSVILLH